MAKKWTRVAENLFRHASGALYLRVKVGGKIIERSLNAKDVRAAKMKRDRLLLEIRSRRGIDKGGNKVSLDRDFALDSVLDFYRTLPKYQEKPSNLHYRQQTLKVLKKTLPKSDPVTWTPEKMREWWASPEITRYSATRRNGTLDTLRQVISLLVDRGDLTGDPTAKLQRAPVRQKEIMVPTREEFREMIQDIRSQRKRVSDESADMIEFLAYSGCRIGEARAVRWADIGSDFIRVTGGEKRTKSGKARSVPIIPPMRDLLGRMRERNSKGNLFFLTSPRFALLNSCERLKLDHFTPHTMRHLFATTCIESGIDIPTVAKWMGHQDGGALAMKTYGHLRDDHSVEQAKKVDF